MSDALAVARARDVLEDAQLAVDIDGLAERYPDDRELELDVTAIGEVDDHVQRTVLRSPAGAAEAFVEAAGELADQPMSRLSVRFHTLPEHHSVPVGGERVRDGHLASLVAFDGQVTKRTEVLPKLEVGVFECWRCGTHTTIDQATYGSIRQPRECAGCETMDAFRLVDRRSEWTDYQLVRLQQPPEDAVDGATAYLDVHLTGDLCGDPDAGGVACGERGTVVGTYEAVRQRNSVIHEKTVVGNNWVPEQAAFETVDTDLEGDLAALAERPDRYEVLIDAVAPGHRGNQDVKEALLWQLFGGWSRTADDGTFHRGNSHLYLVGDPGVGKSILLEAAAELAPRAALTDGTGTSAAGLTASMVKDDFGEGNAWTIQAGTLPLATDGLAVVDELDKGDGDELDALHTALESQEVRISKAGRQAVLPAETSLLAAGNPTGGHYDPTRSFADQVDIQSPLLSRFDLIFVMRQREDESHIREVASHMTETRQTAGRLARGEAVDDDEAAVQRAPVDRETVTRYIAHARAEYQPLIRDAAVKDALVDWYTGLRTTIDERTGETGPPLPVTARKLDAATRLAEARARAHLREEVLLEDVEAVTTTIERSLADIGVAPSGSSAVGTVEDVDAGEVGL